MEDKLDREDSEKSHGWPQTRIVKQLASQQLEFYFINVVGFKPLLKWESA